MTRAFRPRLGIVGVVAVVLAAMGCSADRSARRADAQPEAQRPDVLLISIDTLRSDHLASYGYHRETTPTLDRLAREGARATRSWSQSSSTVPTHASLFTGRFPFQHGTFTYLESLPEAAHTLAEHLRDRGYRTFCVGASLRFRLESGFFQGCETTAVFDGDVPKNDRTSLVHDEVVARLADEDERPVFGFVHLFDPHEPYAVPEPWRHRWNPGLPEPKPEDTSTFLQAHRQPSAVLNDETLTYLRDLYDAGIAFQDAGLAKLLADVETPDRDLLIIVTSDHGEEFKEHGGLSHAVHLHEELLRVPWIAHWPGQIPAGTLIEQPVQSVDLFPTLLDLLDLPQPEGMVGRSFAAELRGRPPAAADGSLDLTVHQQNAETWAIAASLADGRFKLLVQDGNEPRLFHLDSDPSGRIPVDERHPEARDRMLRLAREIGVDGSAEPTLEPGVVAPSDEVLEQLRALGYLDEAEGSDDAP